MSHNKTSAVSCRQVCSSFGQVHNRPAPGIKVSTLVYPKYQVQAATGYVQKVNTKPTLVPIIKSSQYGSKFAPPIQWEFFLKINFGWIFCILVSVDPPLKRIILSHSTQFLVWGSFHQFLYCLYKFLEIYTLSVIANCFLGMLAQDATTLEIDKKQKKHHWPQDFLS